MSGTLATRLGRLLRGSLALPRRLVRHPLRTLAVGGLLALIALGASVAAAYGWAAYHLRAARAEMNCYHTSKAIEHLKASLMVWPHDTETLILAARASRRAGALEEAARCLERCPPLHGKTEADLVLERNLLRMERGELEGTRKVRDDVLKREDPTIPLVLEAWSKGCLRMYRPLDADGTVKEWLERQPDNPQALDIQGQIRELQQLPEEAIECYRRALAADLELDDVRRHLCAALMQLNHYDEALPQLELLSRRVADDVVVKVHLARARAQMGQTEEAENLLREALSLRPQFAPALAERGKLALLEGRTDEAEQWLRQAIALEPGDTPARYQLSLCLERNGKTDEARQEQARLRELEADAERLQEISAVKMQQDPHNADLHCQAGVIALRAGNVAEGLRWLHSALREDPNHQESHRELMKYYQSIRDFPRAREHRAKLRNADRLERQP
jgi:tetratricopeptide (TPR) repeat protein